MSVTQAQVAHVAKLAKLQLNPHELENYTDQFNDVLDYMKVLDKIDTTQVLATNQVTGLESVLREDEFEDYPQENREKLMREVPVTKNGYVVVPDPIS